MTLSAQSMTVYGGRTRHTAIHVALFAFLASTLVVISLNYDIQGISDKLWDLPARPEYTYRGRDYPQEWPIPPLDLVHLSHEDSVHYSIDTLIGAAEWNATLPSGGAILHLGPNFRPFTLGMFHQLRCLNIVREVIVDLYADESPDAKVNKPTLVRHCMNYLRQTVLCRADMRMETVRAPKGHQMTVSDVTHTCRDWTTVYEAAERNHQLHQMYLSSVTNS